MPAARRRRPRAVTPLVGAAAMDAGLTERQWAAQVEGWLRFYGWRYHHSPDNKPNARGAKQRVGDRGFPDYVATRRLGDGLVELAFLELKSETGRLGPGQADWLDDLEAVARAAAGPVAVDVIVGVYRPRHRLELEDLLAGPRGRNVYVPGHRDPADL